MHGQDALYYVTSSGVYAKIGDKPRQSTPPRRLPGSRGAVGTRASAKLGSGIVVASQDGLYQYVTSRAFSGIDDGSEAQTEMTNTERGRWTEFIGSDGSNVVVCEFRDEVWAWNATSYIRRSKDGVWSSGDFFDSVKAALGIPTRGLFFVDSSGRLMEITSAVDTDNGEEVTWRYKTGIEDTQRVALRNMIVMATGAPSVAVEVYDGENLAETYGPTAHAVGKQYTVPFNTRPGFRHRVTFTGTSGMDSIDSVFLDFEGGVASGRGN